MNRIRKIIKGMSIFFTVMLVLLLLTLIVLAVYHRIRLPQRREELAAHGLYQPVSVGDHSLNLVSFGGAEDGHRIIALSGNGAGFPLELREMADELTKENQVYYLARPGYDGSDDVKNEMTVEFVVEDYRKALQNAGVEAPYVLMPHSYASLPASYWVSKYPEEIEAMVDLDGVIAFSKESLTEEQIQEAEEGAKNPGLSIIRGMVTVGIMDVAMHSFFPKDEDLSEEDQRLSDDLTLMTWGSRAFGSEIRNALDNITGTWDAMTPNDVPKLYISAENGYHSAEELEAADVLSDYRIRYLTGEDFDGTEEERRAKAYELEWEEMLTYKAEKMQPFFERLGNCQVADLPGNHFIHLDQPQACAQIILDFLHGLE